MQLGLAMNSLYSPGSEVSLFFFSSSSKNLHFHMERQKDHPGCGLPLTYPCIQGKGFKAALLSYCLVGCSGLRKRYISISHCLGRKIFQGSRKSPGQAKLMLRFWPDC